MSFFDLVSLILENLGRRKARVGLTAIGVVIGTAAIIVLVSLAIGLQKSATERLYGIGDLSLITVYPNYGGGYGPGVPSETGNPEEPKLITNKSLEDMAAVPGVSAVIPREYQWGETRVYYNRLEGYIGPMGVGTDDLSMLGYQVEQGTTKLDKGTAVIGYYIPQNFYDPHMRPGQAPPEPPDLLNQSIKLVLVKYDNEGNQTTKSIAVRIVGVLPEMRDYPDWTMFMRLDDVTSMNEWFTGRRINRNKDGYNEVVVKVADVKNVIEITDQIIALGYQASTLATYVEGINSFFVILQVVFGGVGMVALLVAAIGIANTMTMSILERTREIGLMKAIGATNRDILSVFLGEAAGIGLIGGLGGVLIGWSFGQILNVFAISYLAGQAAQQGGPPPTTAVVTPPWLLVFALVFAAVIGILSGLYPALRAATLVPVNALKYE